MGVQCFGGARGSEEDNSTYFRKTGKGQGSGDRKSHDGYYSGASFDSIACKGVQHAEIDKPFAHEAVKWGQSGNGDCAKRETYGCCRHLFPEATHPAHDPGLAGMNDGPRSKE
ncbi:MAG: hypothetical protein BWY82_01552 [Verrucomicrobia bacterium ADurb.Bin474]|nr:MAG: hypothetical protein BWY82_01552 [Verrucomicrobia bacterium ADurb.Bin474]